MFGIFFPWMHSRVLNCELPPWVYFLDPGLSEKNHSHKYWRPESLPLDPKTAQKYIDDSLLFGRQFQNPRELSYLGGSSFEDFFLGTSMAIKSEIRSSGKSSSQEKIDKSRSLSIQAQMSLLLAWYTEKNIIEYQEIEQGLQGKWDNFRDSLGIIKEDLDPLSLTSSFLNEGDIKEFKSYSWQRIIPWFLCFLPEEAALFIIDQEIYQSMNEYGITFEQNSSFESNQNHAPKYLWSTKPYGWEICMQSCPSETIPWLNKRYKVLFGQCH